MNIRVIEAQKPSVKKKKLRVAVKCSPFVRQCGIIEIYRIEI